MDNSSAPVRSASGDLEAAAGEFGAQIGPGAAAYEPSWRVALDVMAAGSAMIGTNIGNAVLDFTSLDVDYSGNVTL